MNNPQTQDLKQIGILVNLRMVLKNRNDFLEVSVNRLENSLDKINYKENINKTPEVTPISTSIIGQLYVETEYMEKLSYRLNAIAERLEELSGIKIKQEYEYQSKI